MARKSSFLLEDLVPAAAGVAAAIGSLAGARVKRLSSKAGTAGLEIGGEAESGPGKQPGELAGFAALVRSPKSLHEYLNQRILDPRPDHRSALELDAPEASRESGHEGAGRVLAGPAVARPMMQMAMRRLAMNGRIIFSARGEYALADSPFAQWLHEQIRSGALAPPAAVR